MLLGMMWPQQIPSVPQKPPPDPGMLVAPVYPSRPLSVDDQLQEEPQPRTFSPDSVYHWMQNVVVSCGPEQTLGELSELLSLNQISGAPVVDDQGQLLGVVSQTDVAAYLGGLYTGEIRGGAGYYQGLMGRISSADPGVRGLLETKTVQELLTPHVCSVTPDASLDEVMDLMLHDHVHRLLVVDQGRLVGVVTTLDVLRVLRDLRSHRAR